MPAYCFEPHGDWTVDASPAPFRPPGTASFHVVVEGKIWANIEGHSYALAAGDIMMLSRGQSHYIGAGSGGRLISPGDDLPPPPWPRLPTVRYAAPGPRVRMLCGFIEAMVLDFPPLLASLPSVIVAHASDRTDWLEPTVRRLVLEIDHPSAGGMVIAARLTEIIFIEMLRRQIAGTATGWLAAVADPIVRRALILLHEAPERAWTTALLAAEAAVSKSVLCDRFARTIGSSPIRYLRQWRLYLASAELADSVATIIQVAERAGYCSEAAFSRAFARQYHLPPASWRRSRRA